MSLADSTNRAAGAAGPWHRTQGGGSRRARICLSAGAVTAAVLTVAASAGASTSGADTVGAATAHGTPAVVHLTLRAMPAGTVTFSRGSRGHLTVHADTFGLTPGSRHSVSLVIPGRSRTIWFGTLTANGVGQADRTLQSNFTGHLPRGSRLVIRMGVQGGRVAKEPIAETRRLSRPAGGRTGLSGSKSARPVSAMAGRGDEPPSPITPTATR